MIKKAFKIIFILMILTNVASANTTWILNNGTISGINLMNENVSIVDENGNLKAFFDVKVVPIPTVSPTPIPTPIPTPTPVLGTFQTPTFNQIFEYWNRTDTILTNAVIQNPDGSWGGGYAQMEPTSICTSTHPLMRETAHATIGYLHAYNLTHNETYKLKAVNGLNYILSEQLPNGGFNWYCSATDIYANLYETGLGGRALAEGYIILGDTRYLTASAKAIDYERYLGADTGNANFNGFPISHMVKHYQATNDVNVLNTAISFTKTMIAGQTINGHWSDAHNQIYYYQMIMTIALIQVDSIIPSTHPDKALISNAKDKAINYIVTHQNADGSMYYNPTTPTANNENEDYFSEVINGNSVTEDTIEGLIQFQLNNPDTGIYTNTMPTGSSWREGFEMKPVLAGYVLEYYANKNGIVFEIPTPTPITPTYTPIKFITIGDPQGAVQNTTDVVNFINTQNIDFAVFLGDYINIETVNVIKTQMQKPYYVVEGNHDAWGVFQTYFNFNPGQLYYKNGYQIVIPAYDFSSYNWNTLNKTMPTIVFNHGGVLVNCGAHDSLHQYAFPMKTEIDKLNTIAMYNGHIHTWTKEIVNGTLFVSETTLSNENRGTCTDAGELFIGLTEIDSNGIINYSRLNYKNNVNPTPTPTPITTAVPTPTPTPTPIVTPTPTPISTPTTNLLQNPGFEETPLKWTLVTNAGNTPIIDTISHTGSKSVKISSSTTVISGYPKSENIIVSGNTMYTISAWGKLQNAAGEMPLVRVVQLDSNKNWIKQTNLPAFGTGTVDWTQRTLDITTRSNTAYVYVYANIWGGSGSFWVDDVEVKLKT